MFGYTLILAGVARLIEICFVAPKYTQDTAAMGDGHSERTLDADANRDDLSGSTSSPSRAFRHLPSFVSTAIAITQVLQGDTDVLDLYDSSLSLQGAFACTARDSPVG